MISIYITSHEVPLLRACVPMIKTIYSESPFSIYEDRKDKLINLYNTTINSNIFNNFITINRGAF